MASEQEIREAIRRKQEELSREPSSALRWRELGSLFRQIREQTLALKAFEKAVVIDPDDAIALEELRATQMEVLGAEIETIEAKVPLAREAGQDVSAFLRELAAKEAELDRLRAETRTRTPAVTSKRVVGSQGEPGFAGARRPRRGDPPGKNSDLSGGSAPSSGPSRSGRHRRPPER